MNISAFTDKNSGWNDVIAENERMMTGLENEYRTEAKSKQALGTYVVLATGRCARFGNTWRVVKDRNLYKWECDTDGRHKHLPYTSPTPFFELQRCFNSLAKRVVLANEDNLPAVVGKVETAGPKAPKPFRLSDKRLEKLAAAATDKSLVALLKALQKGRPIRVFHLE